VRANRNPNEVIEGKATFGQRIADRVAGFGGSWTFIIIFLSVLVIYSAVNIILGRSAWIPIPSFFSICFFRRSRDSSASDHDEPKPPGHEGPPAQRTGF